VRQLSTNLKVGGPDANWYLVRCELRFQGCRRGSAKHGQGAPDKSERRPVSDAEASVFEKEEVPYATRCEHRLHFLCPNDAEGDRFDVYQAAQCMEMQSWAQWISFAELENHEVK
jgi:hypothetical protein